jgi:glycosyltransferase involved in cell wall biosynthesis
MLSKRKRRLWRTSLPDLHIQPVSAYGAKSLKKLLVLSELYWPERGGAELATHLILKILRKKFDVTVVTGTACPERLSSVNYFYSKLLDAPNKVQLWRNLGVLSNTPWFVSLVRNSDVVYIPRCSYPVIPLAKRFNKRVIVHVHNYQLITYCSLVLNGDCNPGFIGELRHSAQFEVLENRSSAKAFLSSFMSPLNKFVKYWNLEADKIICVSNRQREIIGAALPELSSKLTVIRNPLSEVPLIGNKPQAPLLMYLGGDSYIKGFNVFLQASKNIISRNADLNFLLLGRYTRDSKSLIGTHKEYWNLGYVSKKDVWNLYSKSRALFFPSITEEPLPYAVVESMLCGTIPIGSMVGGVPEIVKGTQAERMMFPPGDVESSVQRIEEVLSLSKETLIDIGVDLRKNILQKFDPEKIAEQLLEVFD